MRLIDADELLTELNNIKFPGAPYVDAGIKIAVGKICDAPTIEPGRKKGKWIHIHNHVISEYSATGYFILRNCECSECGAICEQESNFCPNCGADMRGDQNEAD